MRIFSYQNKKRAKILLLVVGCLLSLLLIFVVYRFILVGRYIRVVNGTVTLDYDQKYERDYSHKPENNQQIDVDILVEEPVPQVSSPSDLPMEPLNGNYISTQMLLDMDLVSSTFAQLPTHPDTVMLDLKSIYGYFYYSSNTKDAALSSADIPAIDAFIKECSANDDIYLVARIASLSDINYALAHQSYGLPRRDGALWMCEDGCYWIDPMEEDVQKYLVSIAQELAGMGFDEIVFDNFQIPDSENIKYNREITREDAAFTAAGSIRDMLSGTPIRVSFISVVPQVLELSDRIYLTATDGSSVSALVESVSALVDDPLSEIVFITTSRDTRFDGYGILRPLIEPREE